MIGTKERASVAARRKGREHLRSFEAIGDRLRLSRMATGLDQTNYARACAIAQNTYNQYERGKSRPSLDHAFCLCDTYNLTLGWIYDGDASGLPPSLHAAIMALRATVQRRT